MASSNTEIIEDLIVRSVRVVVHKAGGSAMGVDVNHWSIYLLLDDSRSVRLNMNYRTIDDWPISYQLPEGADHGEPGEIKVTHHRYNLVHSAITHWDVRCRGEYKVEDYIGLLRRKGRHYYTMAVGGSGCRHW